MSGLTMDQRIEAMRDLNRRLRALAVDQNRVISSIRMNTRSIVEIMSTTVIKHVIKPWGQPDWPLGAFTYLDAPYNAYIFVDNTLEDFVFEIDLEKE